MKFFIDNIWLIALAVLSGGALLFPIVQRSGKKISILQATQLLNAGKAGFLDVRDANEYASGHVLDSRHIPLADLATRASELQKWKTRTIVVLCQSGVRSARALSVLTKAGYTDVVSLEGGLEAWQTQGLPLAK